MSEVSLYDVYSNEAVRDFGKCYRNALIQKDDYASLTELENVEAKEDFAEAIKKFLRRNFSKEGWKPRESSLEEVMKLVDSSGVRIVRAAIISHALTWREKETKEGGQ